MTCRRSRRWRSSSTGPAGSARARRRRRRTCGWSPTSSAGSTACRWPSSSPPAGCPRFSLADLHARLDRALDLLGGGRPSGDARHRTLRATVEWSYQLLTEDERRLFRHLSVFVDGVDLDAAERLAADLGLRQRPGNRALARLVDASMIDAEFDAGTRYRMLETLRAFGLDRLAAAGEEDDAAGRMLALGRRARPTGSRSTCPPSASPRPTPPCAGSCRTCGPRGGWPGAAAHSTTRPRSSSRCSTRSPTATWSRSAAGPRSWPPTSPDPALATHPRRGRGARHRGRGRLPPRRPRAGRAARPRRARARDRRRSAGGAACPRCRWPRWPAGRTPRPSSTPCRPRPGAGPARTSGSPPWPRPTPATSTGRGR